MCDAPDAAEANWFFDGGGEVGEWIRTIDWTRSPIRHQRHWAPELKTALRLLLASPHPMTLWWGQDRVTFYNDAAMPLLGNKHPEALGAAAPEVWHPHWTKLRLDGAESSHVTSLVSIQVDQCGELIDYRCTRVGLLDSSGRTTGAVCEFTCDVDVRARITRRRLALLEQVQRGGASARTWADVGRALTQSIEANPCGFSFAMLYSLDPTRPRLALVGSVGIEAGHPAAPSAMPVDGTDVWPIEEVFRTRVPIRMPRFTATSGLTSWRGLGGTRPGTAFAIPLARGEADGLLIVGFDAAAVFEPETLQFLSILGGQISACVAHATLAHNRSTFQTLADTAPIAIFIKDVEGRYVFANPLARSMLPSDALVGLKDADVLPAETAARLWGQDQQVMADADAKQLEERFGDRTFLLIKFPWRNADGGMLGLYGVAVDITQRKQTEDTLRRIEKKYRAIGESINYGVWVCDADGRNIFMSESFLTLTGLSQQQCSDYGWGGVLHPDDVERTLRMWQACLTSGTFWSSEHRVKGVDGRYHFVLARGVPVRNDAGEIERWVGINLDIGQMKEAEQQLREADRRNDQLLAMLAHELRNPLVPIRNSLHLMHASGLATTQHRDAYDVISRQVENLVRLISDMLDLGRIAQHKLALRLTQIDLSGLIDAAIETALPHLDRYRHELVIRLPEEPVSFTGDAERLVQVVSSLVINSATYPVPGGRIELTARRVAGDLEVTVTDNGVAALPELQRSAADTLAQYQNGLRFSDGAGIGLALVKDLVQMHGGTVGPGENGTVCIRLPIAGPLATPTDSFSGVESAA